MVQRPGNLRRGHVGGGHHETFLTIADVAGRLQVATRTVRRWVEADELVVHRIGGVVRIAESDLRAFLATYRGG